MTTRTDEVIDGLLDTLASIEHERWAHWQKYMHEKARKTEDGSLIIPPELVTKWERQIGKKFADLSEKEKESDRDQVRKYLPIIKSALNNAQ